MRVEIDFVDIAELRSKIAHLHESLKADNLTITALQQLKKTSIEEVRMPTRLRNVLKSQKVEGLEQLAQMNKRQLDQIPGIGKAYIRHLEWTLKEYGFTKSCIHD